MTNEHTAPPGTDDLIGTVQAAALLGISIRTAHRRIKAGQLIPAMIAPGGAHGAYLFRLADIYALMGQRRDDAA